MPTIFHVEDDEMVASLVRGWISMASGLVYLGCAATLNAGLECCRTLVPDIVLLDLRLPDSTGLEGVQEFTSILRAPRVILLTSRRDDCFLIEAKRSPVAGIVAKSEKARTEIPAAVESCLAGRFYVSPQLEAEMDRARSSPHAYYKLLSRVETALLREMGRGATDLQIAQTKGLAESTVQTHRRNIMRKIGVNRSVDLIEWSRKMGFLE